MTSEKILLKESNLRKKFKELLKEKINIDMSRGKPCKEQLELSKGLLSKINSRSNLILESGIDCRNYGFLDGIEPMKKIFAHLMDVDISNVIIGGSSSLSLMFDVMSCFFIKGVPGSLPWKNQKVKFLCPVPGYDRHFAMLEHFDIEPIIIHMKDNGPDMDRISELVSNDETIKGIWCVPKYSNPQGITYSNSTVKKFALLKPAARDFRIFWDNAYIMHSLYDVEDHLLNIFKECKVTGNIDLPIAFCSTSKMTFPGSGVSALAASDDNIDFLKNNLKVKTISFDKVNQLRHALFLKDELTIREHMQKHAEIIRPKFDLVISQLEKNFKKSKYCRWTNPKGGYFISVDVMPGCAKRVVELCKELGVILTPAGATFPRGYDPYDSNIRLAPTYPEMKELEKAMKVFCLCVNLAVIEKYKGEYKID